MMVRLLRRPAQAHQEEKVRHQESTDEDAT